MLRQQKQQRRWIPCPAHLKKSFYSNRTVLTALLCVQEALVGKSNNTSAVPVVSIRFGGEASVERRSMVNTGVIDYVDGLMCV